MKTNCKNFLQVMIATLFRLFPMSVKTGLVAFGDVDENSPVFVTSNYALTVHRVSKHLKKLNCYLLIAPSKGINVWCAADGGFFNAHSLISVIKTSGIADKVKHRRLIVPQLSASGVDIKLVQEKTGWNCMFGPVYASNIPEYLSNNCEKTDAMCRVKFGLLQRLDVGIGSSFFGFLLFPLLMLIFLKPLIVINITVLGFFLLVLMYSLYPYLPGKTGYMKLLSCEVTILALFIVNILLVHQTQYDYLLYSAMIIVPLIGIDWGGVSSEYVSNLDPLLAKLGIKKIGVAEFKGTERMSLLTNDKAICFAPERCIGCGLCREVCPKAIYTIDRNSHKATITNFDQCIKCRACTMQCPTKAIFID